MPSPHALRQTVLDYLRAHSTMTLATAGQAGPWAAAVFYVNDGFDLIWLSEPGARHSQDIAARPQVAATINQDADDWRQIKGVQLEGLAEAVGPVPNFPELLARYVAKFAFLGDPARLSEAIRRALANTWFYRLRPARLYYLDNSGGLGNRVEVSIHDA